MLSDIATHHQRITLSSKPQERLLSHLYRSWKNPIQNLGGPPNQPDETPSTTTLWSLLDKKCAIHLIIFGSNPITSNSLINRSWGTLSNTFHKSRIAYRRNQAQFLGTFLSIEQPLPGYKVIAYTYTHSSEEACKRQGSYRHGRKGSSKTSKEQIKICKFESWHCQCGAREFTLLVIPRRLLKYTSYIPGVIEFGYVLIDADFLCSFETGSNIWLTDAKEVRSWCGCEQFYRLCYHQTSHHSEEIVSYKQTVRTQIANICFCCVLSDSRIVQKLASLLFIIYMQGCINNPHNALY